jgi:hypothetical protein
MTSGRPGMRGVLMVLALSLLGTGCGSDAVEPTSPVAATLAAGTPPAVTAGPPASAGAEATLDIPPLRSGGTGLVRYLGWEDPAYEVKLPDDWRAVELAALRASMVALARDRPKLEPVADQTIGEIDRREARLSANGSTGAGGPQREAALLYVLVEPGDASLDAAVDRHVAEDTRLYGRLANLERTQVALPAGRAVRVVYDYTLTDFGVNYSASWYLRLADGRTLTLYFTSGQGLDRAGLLEFASRCMETLRTRP